MKIHNKTIGLAFRAVVVIVVLSAAFFLPAGSLDWPEAWLVLGVYIGLSLSAFAWMNRHDPDLLQERISAASKKDAKSWDNLIMLVYSILMLVLIAVSALDRVRCGWSRIPLVVKAASGLLMAIPAILIFRVIRENRFLSERVRIQEDRGHRVCSTGPYAVVRHPMYVAIILFTLLLPMTLGSLYGLIPAAAVVWLLVLRTYLEDRTLLRELMGYREYAEKVHFRLIPKIW